MRKGHDQQLVDVICQHNKDGSMIPMRVRLTDEDGAVQTYTFWHISRKYVSKPFGQDSKESCEIRFRNCWCNFKTYDFLRTKPEIVRNNPASPDTPIGKPVAWSNKIIDFSIKINNLWLSGWEIGKSFRNPAFRRSYGIHRASPDTPLGKTRLSQRDSLVWYGYWIPDEIQYPIR